MKISSYVFLFIYEHLGFLQKSETSCLFQVTVSFQVTNCSMETSARVSCASQHRRAAGGSGHSVRISATGTWGHSYLQIAEVEVRCSPRKHGGIGCSVGSREPGHNACGIPVAILTAVPIIVATLVAIPVSFAVPVAFPMAVPVPVPIPVAIPIPLPSLWLSP